MIGYYVIITFGVIFNFWILVDAMKGGYCTTTYFVRNVRGV